MPKPRVTVNKYDDDESQTMTICRSEVVNMEYDGVSGDGQEYYTLYLKNGFYIIIGQVVVDKLMAIRPPSPKTLRRVDS